jgi:hypothetical protein
MIQTLSTNQKRRKKSLICNIVFLTVSLIIFLFLKHFLKFPPIITEVALFFLIIYLSLLPLIFFITKTIALNDNLLSYKKYFLSFLYFKKEIDISSIQRIIHMTYEYSEEQPCLGWIVEYRNSKYKLCKLKIEEMEAVVNNDVHSIVPNLEFFFKKLSELTKVFIVEDSKFVI